MLDLQSMCEEGQEHLLAMDYLAAEASLMAAERLALEQADFDTLGRLYMPLQEARRQRRQRCGEGTVNLQVLASSATDLSVNQLIDRHTHGQFLIAGWGTIAPAVEFRELALKRRLYAESYLAAVYPTPGSGPRVVVIVPTADIQLPTPDIRPVDMLLPLLPAHSVVFAEGQLPDVVQAGTSQSYAHTMNLWEQLHAPFLAAADMAADPLRRIEAYRAAIRVDYACELAHQKLSDTARRYARHHKPA